jgi:hypothetical protein
VFEWKISRRRRVILVVRRMRGNTMRRIGALLLLVITVCGCGTQQSTPEPIDMQPAVQSNDKESQQSKITPRLWLDEDAGMTGTPSLSCWL